MIDLEAIKGRVNNCNKFFCQPTKEPHDPKMVDRWFYQAQLDRVILIGEVERLQNQIADLNR